MLTLHGTTVSPVSITADTIVMRCAHDRSGHDLQVTFSPADDDGYRVAYLETFDGFQIVSPEMNLERFAADLFMT